MADERSRATSLWKSPARWRRRRILHKSCESGRKTPVMGSRRGEEELLKSKGVEKL